jgi:RHS repeat-associated protein
MEVVLHINVVAIREALTLNESTRSVKGAPPSQANSRIAVGRPRHKPGAASRGAFVGMGDGMARILWGSDDVDPTEPVKASTARGTAPYSAALGPAVVSTALESQDGPMRMAAAVGSSNFTFAVPVAHYPGRGRVPLALDLVYNSRVWQRIAAKMVFDIDDDWPAPGWSLHFGKIVRLAGMEAMFVEPDGTRHPFHVDHQEWGAGGTEVEVWAHTTDGTGISYTYSVPGFLHRYDRGEMIRASLLRSDGTSIEFGARSFDKHTLYASSITDANGNMLTITYFDGVGPLIDTVTDTCGRVIRFHYLGELHDGLSHVTGPGPDPAGGDTELLRVQYSTLTLKHSFVEPVIAYPSPVPIISGLYKAATGTGYFLPPGSYSSYGMLRRVRACRGMSIAGPNQPDRGQLQPGQMSWEDEYNYPDAGVLLTDSPTYTTLTQSWAGQVGDPLVTRFSIQTDADTTRTEITWPDNAKTVKVTKVGGGGTPNGLLSQLTVLDTNGRQLQQTRTWWETAPDGTPQLMEVHDTNGFKEGLVRTRFAYGSEATLPTIVDQYDDAGSPIAGVLRRTETQYVRDPNYLARNLRNLPKTVRVYEPSRPGPPPDVVASWTEYRYDESERQPTPGVVGFDRRFIPGSPSYSPATTRRGNVTTVERFSDAVHQADPVKETRTYDQCGNLCTSAVGVGRTERLYRPEAEYMAPSAIRLVASNPADPTMLEVTATTYLPNGQPWILTDANGQRAELQYEAGGRPLRQLSQTTGATVNWDYDDANLKQTRFVRDGGSPSSITSSEQQILDGRGRVLSTLTAKPEGWVAVDYQYDLRGRLRATSAPHHLGDATVRWSTTDYDALHRPVRRTDLNGGVTVWRYDEAAVPGNAQSGWKAATLRITDPCGRDRWMQFDGLGRIQQVVEPAADSAGSVFPTGGARTAYRYDGNGNVTEINTWPEQSPTAQQRRFRYDSLSRLVRVLLPECGQGITEAPGADGIAAWSFALAYDERSNLISRKDSRGAIVRHHFSGDPLDRLQQISYDLHEVTDHASVVLPCQPVQYTYVKTGDIRRVESEDALGTSKQTFAYDPFAGLSSTTVTMNRARNFPFTIDYPHDTLGRSTGTVYPVLYGDASPQRPVVGLEYNAGDTPLWLTVDGETHASHISFAPSGGIKSLIVGPDGPGQVTETYDYDGVHRGARGQQLTRDGLRLLDLSYDYRPGTFGPGHTLTQQLFTVVDNLDASGNRVYSYDALARLKTATGGKEPTTWVQDYVYDSWGNRKNVLARGELEPGKSALPDGAPGLRYEETTNRLDYPPSYDAAGNLILAHDLASGAWLRYQYDAAGRLTIVTNDEGGIITEYVYGACNRRRATVRITPYKEPDPQLQSHPDPSVNRKPDTVESTTFYVWDGDQVIAEYDDVGPVTGDALVWRDLKVFLGARLLSRRENLSGGNRTLYEHPGLTGTRYVTGPDVQTAHEPLPFGGSMIKEGGGAPAFTSYDRDARAGLDYAVNRFYHPTLGRFMQPDPLGAASFDVTSPQSLNLYTYCGNDPVNRVDPLGLAECMVNCWDWDGHWVGGGGLSGGSGSGTVGTDGGRVGGGGYGEFDPDRYAPSGTGWGDSRLSSDQELGGGSTGTGGSGDAGVSPTGLPGTGCAPNSPDFRDIANWRNALEGKKLVTEWADYGGTWTANPVLGTNGEWYVDTIRFFYQGELVGEFSVSTTSACWGQVW